MNKLNSCFDEANQMNVVRVITFCLVFICTTTTSLAQIYSPSAGIGSVVNGSSNIGIGTNSPDYKLHIMDGAGGAQLKFQRGTGIATINQDYNLNQLYIDASAGLVLNYLGGNVGIGVYNPDYRLQIKDGSFGQQLKFQRGTGYATITQDNNLNQLYIDASAGLVFNYNGGNVGIGVQNPDYRLQIKDGTGGQQLKFQRGTGYATITQDNNVNQLYIDASAGLVLNHGGGNVGIGVQNPDFKLQIKDGSGGQQLKFQRGTGSAMITQDNNVNDLYIDAPSGLFLNYHGGNVGLGTLSADEKLTVKGKIHTQEVRVDLTGGVAPDYVFEKDYDLMSLSEVEAYIQANKHLPEVPSAKEMEKDGMNLKEMNLILLKKVEELTLHLIDLKKENSLQDEKIKILESKLNKQ